MNDVFEQMYKEYSKYHLISCIMISGYCGEKNNLIHNAEDEFRPNVICTKYFNQDEIENEIAFVDKIVPHSIYDSMLMCMNHNAVSINDLCDDAKGFVFDTVYKFVEFISSEQIIKKYGLNNGYLHVSLNYDPYTLDRESGMSEKRFHIHMNYWRQADIDFSTKVRVADNDFKITRRMIDPFTIIGEFIVFDYLSRKSLSGNVLGVDTERDNQYGLPVGLKIQYDGWQSLKERAFIDDITLIHSSLQDCYDEFAKSFFTNAGICRNWERKTLRSSSDIKKNIDKIDWLSTKSRDYLYFLADILRNIPQKVMEKFKKNKDMRIRHMSMNGLNYSISLFTPNANRLEQTLWSSKKMYLVIQIKMFSESGGAGLPTIGGVAAAKLKRNAKKFTSEEVELRQQFHEEFIAVLADKDLS